MNVPTEVYEILKLLHTPNVKPAYVRNILVKDGLDLFRSVDEPDLRGVDRVLDLCEKHGIEIISYYDVRYPDRLKTIDTFPPVVYCRGNTDALKKECAAIVGMRKASEYGKRSAFRIAERLSESNVCIVSGLALGIDTAAHEGCLNQQGITIAILAHGLDTITPAPNIALAERIQDSNGLLLSEHPPGTPIFRHQYIQRNRLQSGLSKCSIIVESDVKGGSMRQAEFSHKQGRRIFVVVPDKITRNNSDFVLSGSMKLVEQYNATPIYSKKDYKYFEELFGITIDVDE